MMEEKLAKSAFANKSVQILENNLTNQHQRYTPK